MLLRTITEKIKNCRDAREEANVAANAAANAANATVKATNVTVNAAANAVDATIEMQYSRQSATQASPKRQDRQDGADINKVRASQTLTSIRRRGGTYISPPFSLFSDRIYTLG
jgi:hypothetical protein